MKECPNCKAQVNADTKFCTNCGMPVDNVAPAAPQAQAQPAQTTPVAPQEMKVTVSNTPAQPNKEGLGTASMIIGIIAIILSFGTWLLLPLLITVPLILVGIILGIVNLVKGGKKFAGLILNGVAIVTSIISAIVIWVLVAALGVLAFMDGPVGEWKCKTMSGTGESSTYSLRVKLGSDKKFKYAPYIGSDSTYVVGTYTSELKDKTYQDYKYYKIVMTPTDNRVSGKYSDSIKNDSTWEFAVRVNKDGKKEGLLVNEGSLSMYTCYEE